MSQTAPSSGQLSAAHAATAGGNAASGGGAPSENNNNIQPPPELTVEEALREEIQLLKQRIVRMQKGHKIQVDQLYEENQMLIQDLLKAEGEIAVLKASGASLASKAGAMPSAGGSGEKSAGRSSGGAGRSEVDPLVRMDGGAAGREKMTLEIVPHDTALSAAVSSEKNLTCVNFSRNSRTASLLVVGGANKIVSLVDWEQSRLLAQVELGGPVLCTSFRPVLGTTSPEVGASSSDHHPHTTDLVAVGTMDGSLTILRATTTTTSSSAGGGAGGSVVTSSSTLEIVQSINLGGQASIGRGASRYIKFARWSACGTLLAVSLGQTVVLYDVFPAGDGPSSSSSTTTTGAEQEEEVAHAGGSGSPTSFIVELKRFYFKDTVEAIALLPAVPVGVSQAGHHQAASENNTADNDGGDEASSSSSQAAVADVKVLPSLIVSEQGNCFLHRVYIDRATIQADADIGWGTEWLNVNEKGDDHVSFSIMAIEPHPFFAVGSDGPGDTTTVAFPYLLLSNNKNRHFVVNTETKRIARSFYGHAAGDYFQPVSV